MLSKARLERRLLRKMTRAVYEYGMIAENDRVLVALSGGKDSWALLALLKRFQRHSLLPFHVSAVTVHPGFDTFFTEKISEYCREVGFEHFVERTNMRDILEDLCRPEETYCPFCARLRRGVLYTVAQREGFSKIALGHHADDLIETLLMAQFFTGEIKSMPPVLKADDGVNVVIRPFCYAFEAEIEDYAARCDFPILACACPMAGRPELQRHRIKELLKNLEAAHPGVKANLLSSLGRVRTRFLMGEPAASQPGGPESVSLSPQGVFG